MKAQIVMAMLLVMSVFAGAAVIARQGADDTQADDNRARLTDADSGTSTLPVLVASGELSSEDIADEVELEAETEIEKSDSIYRAYPAQAFYGQGWAVKDSNKGELANIFFVKKDFVKKNDLSGMQTEVIRGTLRIGNDKFKFMSEKDINTATDGVTSSYEYVVYTSRGKGKTTVGKLTLELATDLSNADVWKGRLKLDDGTSYELSLAIKERAVRKSDDVKTAKETREKAEDELKKKLEQRKQSSEEGEVGDDVQDSRKSSDDGEAFWKKFQRWFSSGKSGSSGSSDDNSDDNSGSN